MKVKNTGIVRIVIAVMVSLAMMAACLGLSSCGGKQDGKRGENEYVGTYWLIGEGYGFNDALNPWPPIIYLSMSVNADGTVQVVNHSPNTQCPDGVEGTWKGFGGLMVCSDYGWSTFSANSASGGYMLDSAGYFFGPGWLDLTSVVSLFFIKCDDEAVCGDFQFDRIAPGTYTNYEIQGRVDANGVYVDVARVESFLRSGTMAPATLFVSSKGEAEATLYENTTSITGRTETDISGLWWPTGSDTATIKTEWDKGNHPLNVRFLDNGAIELRSDDNFVGWGDFEGSQCLVFVPVGTDYLVDNEDSMVDNEDGDVL